MEVFMLENGKEGKFHIFVELKKNIGNYETVSVSGSLTVQIESDKKFAQEFEDAFCRKVFPAIKAATQHAVDDVVKDLARRIANVKKALETEQNPLRRKKLTQVLENLLERFYQVYDFSDLEFARQVENGQYTGGE